VGEVVRAMEGSLEVIDCNTPAACPILPACVLKEAVNGARDAFLAALDAYTLADLLGRPRRLLRLLAD
jgi:Rrf2 family nitric oxide-sensitive transcriptional repressor